MADAGYPHRSDVEEDSNHTDPEVEVGETVAVELGVPEARDEPVEHARRHEAVPAEGAAMDVADDPVGVVPKGVDGLNGEEWAFEGRHAVERQAGSHKLDDGVGT